MSQLAEIFPSIPMMMEHAPPIVRLVLAATDQNGDFSVRSQNQRRQDLHSGGPR